MRQAHEAGTWGRHVRQARRQTDRQTHRHGISNRYTVATLRCQSVEKAYGNDSRFKLIYILAYKMHTINIKH
jgi:hypothetical protein